MAADPPVTDQQRHELEIALVAALTMIYQHRQQQAFDHLGVPEMGLALTYTATKKLHGKARETSDSVQRTMADMIASARQQATDAGDSPDQAEATVRQGAQTYNEKTLVPYLTAWAAHQGLIDAYRAAPSPSGGSMKDASQWQWTRYTQNPPDDTCQDAADASPASYDTLVGLAGGEPPIHQNCQCTLDPLD